jgi:hypothetical protein
LAAAIVFAMASPRKAAGNRAATKAPREILRHGSPSLAGSG